MVNPQLQIFTPRSTLSDATLEQRIAGLAAVLDQEPDLDVEARWQLLYVALFPGLAEGLE